MDALLYYSCIHKTGLGIPFQWGMKRGEVFPANYPLTGHKHTLRDTLRVFLLVLHSLFDTDTDTT